MANEKSRNDINRVILGGRLVADPVVKNKAMFFTLAVQRSKDATDFLPVCIRGGRTERLSAFLKKGSALVVDGRLQQWKDQNGRSRVMVETESVHFGAVGLNQVVLMGRLVSEPECRQTSSQKTVYNFALASERTWKKDDSLESRVSFIDVAVWENDNVMKCFSKGAMCTVAGSLQSRSYKNKDGENRVAYTVSANRVFFAPQTKEDAKDDAEDQGAIVDTASQAAPAYPQTAQAYEIPDDYYVDENAEDLPF